METGTSVTRAQRKFLKEFCNGPHGPGIQHWPSPAILRRWLRKPGFRAALRSLQGVMRFQSDFQLASAAASASHYLHNSVCCADHEQARVEMKAFADLLKLAHVRDRFTRGSARRTQLDSLLFS